MGWGRGKSSQDRTSCAARTPTYNSSSGPFHYYTSQDAERDHVTHSEKEMQLKLSLFWAESSVEAPFRQIIGSLGTFL